VSIARSLRHDSTVVGNRWRSQNVSRYDDGDNHRISPSMKSATAVGAPGKAWPATMEARTTYSYSQRRTRTPFTATQRQAAATGRTTAAGRATAAPPTKTTAAPCAPAQPARATPRAQTTAFASVGPMVMVPANPARVRAASTSKRIAGLLGALLESANITQDRPRAILALRTMSDSPAALFPKGISCEYLHHHTRSIFASATPLPTLVLSC
jgi:hypothetical protein